MKLSIILCPEENFRKAAILSDDDLLTNAGGASTANSSLTEAAYMAVKVNLDAAVAANDYNTFSSIVCQNTSVYGKEFYARVVYDYTKSGFLTTSRKANLNADLVANT